MGNIKIFCLVAALSLALGTDAYSFCFEEAGALYGINPQILRAIAKVESNFNPRAVNKNSNGTFDFGLMQINSSWASTLGKERWNSLGDACSNTKTGAWILSMCMNKYGYTWKAIGCYNSQTPGKRDRYSRLVFDQLQRVKPLAQEAAYTPLKGKLEELVKSKVDDWVTGAAQGKGDQFVVEVPDFAAAAKEAPQQASTPGDPALQSAVPGLVAAPGSLSFGPDAKEGGTIADQASESAPAVKPIN
jgi:hypothetical protein